MQSRGKFCSVLDGLSAPQEHATHEDTKHATGTPDWVLHFKNEKDAVTTYEQIVLIVTELILERSIEAGRMKGVEAHASAASTTAPQKGLSFKKQLSRERLFGSKSDAKQNSGSFKK
jgi:hypothetical protein